MAPTDPQRTLVDAVVTLVAALAVVLGVGLRAATLGNAVVGYDETYTAAFASGRTVDETYALAFRGVEARAGEVVDRISRDGTSRGPLGTIGLVAKDDPHHAPAFFTAAAAVSALGFGRIPELRVLSLAAAIALIAAAYVLGRDLGGDRRSGEIAAAVAALSPLFFSFTLQARPHLAGAAAFAWSTVALVRTVRAEVARDASGAGAGAHRGLTPWVGYALTVALALYTYPVVGVGLAAHLVMALVEPPPAARRRVLARFLGAALAGCLLFAPWLVSAYANRATIATSFGWVKAPISLHDRAASWVRLLGGIRVDTGPGHGPLDKLARLALGAALAGISAAALVRGGARPATATVLALGGGAFAILAAGDAIVGSNVAFVARFAAPSLLGCDLLVALGSARLLGWERGAARFAGAGVLAVTLGLGAASCAWIARAEAHWSVYWSAESRDLSRAVEARKDALLLCTGRAERGASRGLAIAVCLTLPRDARVLLAPLDGGVAEVPREVRSLLVFGDLGPWVAALAAAGFVEGTPPAEAPALLRLYERGP